MIELTITASQKEMKKKLANKRKRLSLQDKVDVIKSSENEKTSARELANKYGVGKTQISEILKNRADILKSWSSGNKLCKRAFPKTKGLIVDSVVYEWFCHTRAYDIPVSGPLIREKALQVAKQIGLSDFKASCGWLDKFRARHSISYKKEQGETTTLDEYAVSEWKKKLKQICEGYSEEDIYNCDATELVFGAVSENEDSETLKTHNESEKVVILLCVNMKGLFEKPLIIGKESKSHCSSKLPDISEIKWHGSNQSLMSKEIMTRWLGDFDSKMAQEGRSVLLFLYQSVIKPEMYFENVKVEFLPSNTATACHPLGQGIIEYFKLQFQQKFSKRLSQFDYNLSEQQNNAMGVISSILSSVKLLTPQMIRYCFIKAGFGKDDESCTQTELEEILQSIPDNSSEYVVLDNNNSDDSIFKVTDLIRVNQPDKSTKAYIKSQISAPKLNDSDELVFSKDDVSCASRQLNDSAYSVKNNLISISSELLVKDSTPHHVMSSKEDADYALRKLQQYFTYKQDDKGLKLLSQIKNHLEMSE